MASKLRRRSGNACAIVCADQLDDWKCDMMIQVGIGQEFEELDVLREEWGDFPIIGFEPHPEIIKNVEKRYPGIVIKTAVGKEPGTGILHSKNRHKSGSSLLPHHQKEGERYKTYEVPIVTLDETLGKDILPYENILLWVDSEGTETDVLMGAKQVVEKVKVINIEMTANPPGEGWCSTTELHDMLVELGFYRQWIHTQRIHMGQYDGIYVRPELFRAKFCCCPYEIKRWKAEYETTQI